MGGLAASRSGLFWEWLRVLDEMPVKPSVIALENVVGLLSGNGGGDFRLLFQALRDRSYKVGPMLLDARLWVPQSRPRVFIVAVQDHLDTTTLEDHGPNWLHPNPVLKAIGHSMERIWKPSVMLKSKLDNLIEQHGRKSGICVPARLQSMLALLESLREQQSLDLTNHLSGAGQSLKGHETLASHALKRLGIASLNKNSGRRSSNLHAWAKPLLEIIGSSGFPKASHQITATSQSAQFDSWI